MIKLLLDFFKTKLGKIVGTVALIIILVLVTIGAYIVTRDNDKTKEEETTEEIKQVMATQTESFSATTGETTTKEETTSQETTIEETTQEETTQEETTEEPTTKVLEVIPMDKLEIVDGDELGEDAEEQRQPVVEVEPETEVETTSKQEEETNPTEEETQDEDLMEDNKDITAPSVSGEEYGCIAHGIDVSKHQQQIDWAKVKAAGYTFAIIRCGYRGYETGKIAEDPRFKENIEGALANGIQVGIYFFSQATTVREAQEEASAVIGLIKDYDITYPVVFDWETSVGWRTDIGLSNATMTSIVNTYLSMVENEGYTGMVYGNRTDLSRFDYATVSKNYKVWFARYTTTYQNTNRYYVAGESTPDTICSYQMWQYKSTGLVPGISTNVDMNVAFFSYEGSGVPAAPLRIELANTELEIRPGENIDLLSGVKAISSSAIDITSNVTYEIFDENDNKITKSVAINTKGTYKVVYYINDFTGVGAQAETILVVDGSPEITLEREYLTWFLQTDCESVSDDDMLLALKEKLLEILDANVILAIDLEGKDITSLVEIVWPQELTFEQLEIGTYLFTYKVIDDKGFESTKVFTLEFVSLSSERIETSYAMLMGSIEEATEQTTEETTVKTENTEQQETTEKFEDIKWDSTAFKEKLTQYLLANITSDNVNGIQVVLDEKMVNAIDDDLVEVGTEYKVTYVMEDWDTSLYYKECIVVFSEWR